MAKGRKCVCLREGIRGVNVSEPSGRDLIDLPFEGEDMVSQAKEYLSAAGNCPPTKFPLDELVYTAVILWA